MSILLLLALQIPPDAHKEPLGFISGGPPTIADGWRRLGDTRNTCSEADLGYDYWPDGGIRNFWCHATSALPWSRFLELVPMQQPWLRGPHGRWKEGKLGLHDKHDFGRYNPAFVQWLVDNAVPAATDPALKTATQPVYNKLVRQLARVYFVVYRHIEAKPAWKKKERALYMKTMDEKNPDWGSFYDKYSELLGDGDHDWGGYDPNLQSASAAFWLRRDVDNTAPLFFDGLTKLLRTYDAEWLAAQQR